MENEIQITYHVEVILTREEVETIRSNEEDTLRYVDVHIETTSEEPLDYENEEITNVEEGMVVEMDYYTHLPLNAPPPVDELLNYVNGILPNPFVWYTGVGVATITPSHITYYMEGDPEAEIIPFDENNNE